MKYKGIELKEGRDYSAELAIGVEFNNLEGDNDIIEAIETKIVNKLRKKNISKFYLETVLNDYTLIRSDTEFTFDKQGVAKLAEAYCALSNVSRITPYISVHLDEWLCQDGGESFNEDMVGLREFLENIEY